jgi:hypothetical protein
MKHVCPALKKLCVRFRVSVATKLTHTEKVHYNRKTALTGHSGKHDSFLIEIKQSRNFTVRMQEANMIEIKIFLTNTCCVIIKLPETFQSFMPRYRLLSACEKNRFRTKTQSVFKRTNKLIV